MQIDDNATILITGWWGSEDPRCLCFGTMTGRLALHLDTSFQHREILAHPSSCFCIEKPCACHISTFVGSRMIPCSQKTQLLESDAKCWHERSRLRLCQLKRSPIPTISRIGPLASCTWCRRVKQIPGVNFVAVYRPKPFTLHCYFIVDFCKSNIKRSQWSGSETFKWCK